MLSLNHKKSQVWIAAMGILKETYVISRKFPAEEKYNLTSQVRRAALPISNNIAEDAARISKAEKKRFFEISRSSPVEVDNCFEAVTRLGYLKPSDVKRHAPLLESDLKMLTALINKFS
jgi:four helix bundle protein